MNHNKACPCRHHKAGYSLSRDQRGRFSEPLLPPTNGHAAIHRIAIKQPPAPTRSSHPATSNPIAPQTRHAYPLNAVYTKQFPVSNIRGEGEHPRGPRRAAGRRRPTENRRDAGADSGSAPIPRGRNRVDALAATGGCDTGAAILEGLVAWLVREKER
jgi:hypothetical protein